MSTSDTDQPKRRRAVRRKEERLLRKQINRYNQLFHIGQLITSEMNFETLFDVIVDQTNQLMDAERSSVFLIDKRGLNLTAFVSTDLKRNEINIPKNDGVAGWVFSNKIPVIISDAYEDSRFYPGIDEKTGFHTKNILCVPLINREYKCIGTLQALNKRSGDFTQEDKEILMHLANYITVALENSRLYEELKASDRAKEKVISRLSHELRTPLAIISAIFELIHRKAKEANDERLQTSIRREQRNIKRLSELQEKVDDIIKERPIEEKARIFGIIQDAASLAEELDETTAGQYEDVIKLIKNRIESIFGIEETQIESIRLDDFINDIVTKRLPLQQRDCPEINTDIEKGLSISMHRSVLEKVFLGLLKNAIENTPDQGRIEVSARSTQDEIQIELRDYGIGITEENQKNIFGGFFDTRSTEYYASKQPFAFNAGGSGLDLLRTKMFAEKFGFAVDFSSTRCKYIPLETDQCPGNISTCVHVQNRSDCFSSGGSIFALRFRRGQVCS